MVINRVSQRLVLEQILFNPVFSPKLRNVMVTFANHILAMQETKDQSTVEEEWGVLEDKSNRNGIKLKRQIPRSGIWELRKNKSDPRRAFPVEIWDHSFHCTRLW